MNLFKVLIDLLNYGCKALGLPEWLISQIIILVLILGVVWLALKYLYVGLKKIALWRNQRILNTDLAPDYSSDDVDRATRFYIDIQCQQVAPSISEELGGGRYMKNFKGKLIPMFLKEAFRWNGDKHKYYLILADAGMGKTTLMINLYIAYKNAAMIPWSPHTYDIQLFPLGKPGTLDKIKDLKNKKNTILLLDAFDEDPEAVKDYKKRLGEILTVVEDFREIVITCRTQFFPSREEEPHETGTYSFGGGGEYKFKKMYLSVFDKKDILKYLKKRFSWIRQRKKYLRALEIAEKSPTLVVRPMLLSHIEKLVDSDRTYEFSFQIYEELIEHWLQRQSEKPGIKEKYGDKKRFKKALLQFSQKLAVHLYKNSQQFGGYFLPSGESFTEGLLTLSDGDDEDLILSESTGKTQSLLNRDANGNYKFSHKSILEYYLAKEFFQNSEFFNDFDFTGMEVAKRFFEEMLVVQLRGMEGEFNYE